MILIVTFISDAHTDYVISCLKKRDVDFIRFNHDLFPSRTELWYTVHNGVIQGELSTPRRTVDLSRVTTVWNRRRCSYSFADDLNPAFHKWAEAETQEAVRGLWSALSSAFWVNPFWAQRAATNKIYQLTEAAAVGFDTPMTLVTNYPPAVARFHSQAQRTVLKALSHPGLGDRRVLYTTVIPEAHFADGSLEDIRLVPGQFQPYIDKAFEYGSR